MTWSLELRKGRSYARLDRLRVDSFKTVKLPRIENNNVVSQKILYFVPSLTLIPQQVSNHGTLPNCEWVAVPIILICKLSVLLLLIDQHNMITRFVFVSWLGSFRALWSLGFYCGSIG